MGHIRRLIIEVHRRSLWQVLTLYLIASWIGYQVILGLTDGVGLPDWVPAFAVVLFVIGLPVVLATAFVQEGLPRGLQAPRDPTLFPASEPPTAPRRMSSLLTWRTATLGGVGAFLLLGGSSAAVVSMRGAGVGPFATLLSAGSLQDREPILLTTFTAADTALAIGVTEGLRVDLEQSVVVAVVPASRVTDALRRMGRPQNERLDFDLGVELAEREGINVVLSGEVSGLGGGAIITARLTEVATGEVLASFRVSARRESDIIDGVDRLSRQIRAKVGESLRSVRRSEPLHAVTTESIDALRLFARSTEVSPAEAIPMLQEAIRLDSTFAMAHRLLSSIHMNRGERQQALEASATAYRLRDRLTERERLMTVGSYHMHREEVQQGIAAYRAYVEKWPDDQWGINNLTVLYRMAHDHENVAKYEEMMLQLDTSRVDMHTALARTYYRMGDAARARSHIDQFRALRPDNTLANLMLEAHWAAASGDFERAERGAREGLDRSTSAAERSDPLETLRDLTGIRGRVAELRTLTRELLEIAEGRGQEAASPGILGREVQYLILHGLPYEQQLAAFRRVVADLWPRLPPLNRPVVPVLNVYAMTGDSVGLARIAADVASLARDDYTPTSAMELVDHAWAVFHSIHGDPLRAVETMRRLLTRCGYCRHDIMGDAFHALEMPDSAIHHYKQWLERPFLNRTNVDMLHRGRVVERLAQLHDGLGERDEARRYYAVLLAQWADADPVLQPRVVAARNRLGQLMSEDGGRE
jgi:tetratricopeptide (TPR) repeat protein